jgi:alanyl-tRNA synthetase
VRRIEALTGPEGVALLRRHDQLLSEAAALLRKRPEEVVGAVADLQAQAKAQRKAAAEPSVDAGALADQATDIDGAKVLTVAVEGVGDPKVLMDLADRVKGRLGDSAIVLAAAPEGRVHLVASVTPGLVERGLKAGDIVEQAAQVVGGGGGGRPTMAQAGGKDASKLPEALATARSAIESALGG